VEMQYIIDRYYELGEEEFKLRGERPFTTIRHHLMTSPLFNQNAFVPSNWPLIRDELHQLIHRQQWRELNDFCKHLRYHHLVTDAQQLKLLDWAESTSHRLGGFASEGEGSTNLAKWRQPLIEELTKSVYNVLADLDVMLESDAFEDAANRIASVTPEDDQGIAPYGDDSQLLLSLPTAFNLATDTSPQLKTIMAEKYNDRATFRIRSAIRQGDPRSVEMTASQFSVTSASAEAHQWLGDRALSSGWFEQAIASYRQALAVADPQLAAQIHPRVRLANAMIGKRAGEPATSPVTIGDLIMAPTEFEAMIEEMHKAHQGEAATVGATGLTFGNVPPVAQFKAERRSNTDSEMGEQPNHEGLPTMSASKVDWVPQQTVLRLDGDRFLLANRFQVSAYKPTDGVRIWKTARPPGKMLRSRDWPLSPMAAIVYQERVYTRLLYENGPRLFCFNRADGKLLWSSAARNNEYVASDPIVVRGQLACVVIEKLTTGRFHMRLDFFDPESGDLTTQHSLAHFQQDWFATNFCTAIRVDDSIVISAEGIALSAYFDGRLKWIRKYNATPIDVDHWAVKQHRQPPLHHGEKVFLFHPGVGGIDCLNANTGQRIWRNYPSKMLRWLGISQGNLIVHCEDHLVAYELEHGQQQWLAPGKHSLHGYLCDDERVVVSNSVASPKTAGRFSPELKWYDTSNGKLLGQSTIGTLEAANPRFGPLFSLEGKLFAFFKDTDYDPNRDIFELVSEKKLAAPADFDHDPWLATVDKKLQRDVAMTFPGWRAWQGLTVPRIGLLPDAHGEKDVVGMRIGAGQPLFLVRELKIPENNQARLRLTFAVDAGLEWMLDVKFNDQQLFTQEINPQTQPQPWKTWEIDLTPVAGQTGRLRIKGKLIKNPDDNRRTYWKEVRISL
jgi:outer membrane protein assembly factor BamB